MLIYFLQLIEEEGEQRKFQELYDAYRYQMLYIAKRILRDHSLAEDAVQNAFLYFVVHIKSVREVNSGETRNYVYLVTKHRAIDIARKRKKEIYLSDEELERIGDGYSHVEDIVFANETSKKISVAITALPKIYRESLELHIVQDLSAKQIASILGVSYETVKKRLQRGKEMLWKEIQ